MGKKKHATITKGLISFWLGIFGLLIEGMVYAGLYYLPPAPYLSNMLKQLSYAPLVVALIGLFFYWLQWKSFVTKIVRHALALNLLTIISTIYLVSKL